MKKLILLSIITIFILASCYKTDTFSHRLNNFYTLLEDDKNIRSSFEMGDTESVAIYITKQKQINSNFNKKYQKIKDFEAINHFTDLETTDFFYKYFFLRLNPDKKQ